jgi:BMFP domain-containing protein YqiC
VIGLRQRQVKKREHFGPALKPEVHLRLSVTRPISGANEIHAEASMAQTSNRLLDEMARLMNDAAGVAEGARREFQTFFRAQAERILRDMDVVTREELDAVKEMAARAREENERLAARLAEIEGRLGKQSAPPV